MRKSKAGRAQEARYKCQEALKVCPARPRLIGIETTTVEIDEGPNVTFESRENAVVYVVLATHDLEVAKELRHVSRRGVLRMDDLVISYVYEGWGGVERILRRAAAACAQFADKARKEEERCSTK